MDDAALVALLRRLDALGYDFVTPSPASHARYLKGRGNAAAAALRDVFGWSLPFAPGLLDAELLDLLRAGDAVDEADGQLRSRYRVSRADGLLFLHSAYPTHDADAVFFGPDTYRFIRFLGERIVPPASRLVDIGAGSGAGAIAAARLLPGARLTLLDVNPAALRLARINAAAAGVEVETVEADRLDAVAGDIDLIIANPPFIIDDAGRTYRDGGGMRGAERSLAWALAGAARLQPGGTMLLYTGVAIVDGADALRQALAERLPALGCTFTYDEIDPDIFGEELESEAYRGVERIAAVGAVIRRGR